MAWTNSNYMTLSTAAARLAGCRAFIAEVLDAIGGGGRLAVDGESRDPTNLNEVLKQAREDEKTLKADAEAEAAASGTRRPLNVFGLRFKGACS